MSEHPNVARIRTTYAEFAAKNLPAVLESFAPDAVFHVAGDGPNSGDHKGREAIAAALVAGVETTGGTQALDISQIYADDSHAVVVVHETATRAADGTTLDMREVHLITLGPDGSVVEFWDIPADPDVHDAFFDGR